ncbi:hypothetical protein Vretimale_15999 [Volvox reticuliferus]|uniref:Uncharacterized protein n=1 Tax=Volvox reticuliferus TaxID=1737510 RepID=A0A8J4FPG6_9CHLO|nr:hypothetical protein Vretifemale_9763 [Volvox reticuliferus]GIM12754.1 hypothetical protein Vretimale_15999 [Volvox reticuliferus]
MPWELNSALSSPRTSFFIVLATFHLCTLVLNVLIRLENDAVPQNFRDVFPVYGSIFQRMGFILSHPHLTYRAVYSLNGGAVWITWNFYITKARLVFYLLSMLLNFRDTQADTLLTIMQRMQAVVYLTCQCFLNPRTEPSPSAFWYLERSFAWNLISHVVFPAGPLEVVYAIISLMCIMFLTVSYVRLQFPMAERMPCILLREAAGNAVLLALEAWRCQCRRQGAATRMAEMAGLLAGQLRCSDSCKPSSSPKDAHCSGREDQPTETRVGMGRIQQPSQQRQPKHEDIQRLQQQQQQQRQQQRQQQYCKTADFQVPTLSPSQLYHHEDGCASSRKNSDGQQPSDALPLNNLSADLSVADAGIPGSGSGTGPAAAAERHEVPPVTAADGAGSAAHARTPGTAGAPPVIARFMVTPTANPTHAEDGRNSRSLYAVPLRPLRDVTRIGAHGRLAAAMAAAATCSTPVMSTTAEVATTAATPTTRGEPAAGCSSGSEGRGPTSVPAAALLARAVEGSQGSEQIFRRLLPPAVLAQLAPAMSSSAGADIDGMAISSLPRAPRYVGWTRLLSTRIKITGEGAQPELISDGYRERIAAVVAAAGQQLEGVYVRRGCIELVIDVRRFRRQGAPVAVDWAADSGELGSSHCGSSALQDCGSISSDNETINIQEIIWALQLRVQVIDDIMYNDQASMDGWQQGPPTDAIAHCGGGTDGTSSHRPVLTAWLRGGYVASIEAGTHGDLLHSGDTTAGAEPGVKGGCNTAPGRAYGSSRPHGVFKFTTERPLREAASGLETAPYVLSVRIVDANLSPLSTAWSAATMTAAAASINDGSSCSSRPYTFSPSVCTSLCGYQVQSSAVDATTLGSTHDPLELSVLVWSAERQSLDLSIRSRDRYLPVAHGSVTWLPAATTGEPASGHCGGCLAVVNITVLELPSPPALLMVGVMENIRSGSPVQGLAPLLLLDDLALQEELNHGLCERVGGTRRSEGDEVATAGNDGGAFPVELKELISDLGGFLQNAAAGKAGAANAATAAALTASGGGGGGSGSADESIGLARVDELRLHLPDLGMHLLQWFMVTGGSQRWPLMITRLLRELASL